MESEKQTEMGTREVLGDYFKEIIGYDNGLLRTIIELKKAPSQVLKSYLTKENKYVGPFRILINGLSLWILVNSFFLDWYQTFENLIYSMVKLIQKIDPSPPKDPEKFQALIAKTAKTYSTIAGDMLSKYFVIYIIVALLLTSYRASKKCKPLGADFRTLLSALAYSSGFSVLTMFVLSVGSYFSIVTTFSLAAIIYTVLIVSGRVHWLSPVPMRKFFETNGEQIEKEVTKASLLTLSLLMLPVVGYIVYAALSPSVTNGLH